MLCDEQTVETAERANGDVTVAPDAGLLTVIALPERTVMARSATPLTPCPQHLTCRICAPAVALTLALKDVDTMVVAPLSIE